MIEFVAGFLAAYGIGAMVLVLYAVREVRKDRKMREAVRRRIVEEQHQVSGGPLWIATDPDVPGPYGMGRTEAEAVEDLAGAVTSWRSTQTTSVAGDLVTVRYSLVSGADWLGRWTT